MKVLVVGGGGREHAMAEKAAQSGFVETVYWSPGSPAVDKIGKIKPIDIQVKETESLIRFSKDNGIDLILPGQEDAFYAGIVDLATEEGLRIYGPRIKAIFLEKSKVEAKRFMQRRGISTADFKVFDDVESAMQYCDVVKCPTVVKADGPALGKGVILCYSIAEARAAIKEIMVDRRWGDSGNRVLFEEMLEGEEATYMVMVDVAGNYLPMATSRDYKRAYDNDKGLNTGGMGVFSPASIMTPELEMKAHKKIVYPTIFGMKEEGNPFVGIIYFGLMINSKKIEEDGLPEIKLLEINVRFGDPEAEVILARMQSDYIWLVNQALIGNLDKVRIKWDPRPAVCVVMASEGYPATSTKGAIITGIKDARKTGAQILFAAVGLNANGQYITAGGRCVIPVSKGPTFAEARRNVYAAVEKIRCDKLFYRKDIAMQAVEWERRN